MSDTYLSFTICKELYAVNVSSVLEVLQNENLTSVPNAPDFIKGIINFRGDIVPVYESRVKFNLPDRNYDEPYVIVIFDLGNENESFKIGAIVDKVKDVITVSNEEIKPVPPMNKEFNTEFIQGIIRKETGFIMLLDISKVFSNSEIENIKTTTAMEIPTD